MEIKTTGTVLAVKTQWWLKINTKPVRMHTFDGARFPHIITVKYTVDGTEYITRKWVGVRWRCPDVHAQVTVICNAERPAKCRLELPVCLEAGL